MSAAYSCTVCRSEIASTATHVATEYSQVLCVPYTENPTSHAVAYPGCPVASHGVCDRAVAVSTRLSAHSWQLGLRVAQEVSGG